MMKARLAIPIIALTSVSAPAQQAEAIFAGGCFWGVQWVFEHVRGVTAVVSGYSGGSVLNPTYELVGTGTTGHAESVRVTYDTSVVSYRELLEVFFRVAHDPTTRERSARAASVGRGSQLRLGWYSTSSSARRMPCS